MAAYAAVVSLIHTVVQIQNHPRFSTCFPDNQIESLLDKAKFFQDFLERYSCGGREEAQDLETRIADAANAAEDVIESHAVDQILGRSNGYWKRTTFSRKLRKVIKALDLIQSVLQSQDITGLNGQQQQQQQQQVMESKATAMAPVARSSSRANPLTGVGLGDEDLIPIMEKVIGTRQDQSARQVVPMVGMGGIGKTTLARAVYENPVIVQYFDVRIWIVITQKYTFRDVLLQIPVCRETLEKKKPKNSDHVLKQIPMCQDRPENSDDVLQIPVYQENLGDSNEEVVISENDLGEALYKSLYGRRYLIVIDDMWSMEVWDNLKFFLPDTGSTGRAIITTRLANVAGFLSPYPHELNFLDEGKSWKLFCENTFVEEDLVCPPEFEKVGRKIVEKCKGLPIALVVIGRLLAKSHRTLEHWERVAKDINSLLNSEDDTHFLNLLSLSYIHLPAHLKPCFLYLGIFSDNYEIHASQLIKLWVAEGFLKSDDPKSLEEVAEGYLKDLVGRNLILARRWKFNGKIKIFHIHDVLRDVCLRVARKEKFLSVLREIDFPKSTHLKRHTAFHVEIPEARQFSRNFRAMQSARLVRSLACRGGVVPLRSKLLRVLDNVDVITCKIFPSTLIYVTLLVDAVSPGFSIFLIQYPDYGTCRH